MRVTASFSVHGISMMMVECATHWYLRSIDTTTIRTVQHACMHGYLRMQINDMHIIDLFLMTTKTVVWIALIVANNIEVH